MNDVARMTVTLPSGATARIWLTRCAAVIDINGRLSFAPSPTWPVSADVARSLAKILTEATQ